MTREVGEAMRGLVERPTVLAKAYEAYGAAITPTRFLRDAYLRNGLRVPVREITFGVDVARNPKPIRSNSDPLAIGYVGQMAPHKGVELLVSAFAAVGAGHAELHIFGSESQDPHYSARIRRASEGLPVRLRGTFPKERMRSVLDELDLLVIPSRWYENSPLVLLNALASHTPVLVSDVEGMTEFVQPPTNGFTFMRGDVDDLTDTLRAIVAAPESLRAMAETTNYTRTTAEMTQDVVRVYDDVVGSK